MRRKRVLFIDLGQRAVQPIVLPKDAPDGRLVTQDGRHGRVVHLHGEGVLGLTGRGDALVGVVHCFALL